ncbi:MAG: T9SS type A sorting domain-containing protein [Bacteroidota bacterium]
MKNLIIILAICLFHFSTFASHLYGGYITTKKLSGRQYEISVTILGDPHGAASQTSIKLSFGDGDSQTVARLSLANLEDNFRSNIYKTIHEYQSDGVFIITYSDPNLVDNIVNVNGGQSSNSSLVIESMIRVSPTLLSLENPRPLAYTFPSVAFGKSLTYNPTFIDAEGDNIVYELLSSTNLLNYQLPAAMTMNQHSGMVTWNNINFQGLYLIQYKVSSYESNGILNAYTIVTQMIRVVDLVIDFPTPVHFPNTDLAPAGWYRSVVNTSGWVQQPFIMPLNNNTNCNIEVYSELLHLNGRIETNQNDSQHVVNFFWEALAGMNRPTLYFVTFRLQSTKLARVSKDYNVAFYHGAPLTTGVNEWRGENEKVSVYPNPSTNGSCIFLLPTQSPNTMLHIYDMAGKEIVNTPVIDASYTWDHSSETTGLYFYQIEMPDGHLFSGKVMINH